MFKTFDIFNTKEDLIKQLRKDDINNIKYEKLHKIILSLLKCFSSLK